MKRGALPVEVRAFALPAAAVAAFLLPVALAGMTTFWGDLTYLHQAWRASPAQLVQGGRLPLWEPSLYFGMPMLAPMQGGLLYPATSLFYFFGFATATWLYQLLHLLLASALTALWLRSLRLSWGASATGGLVFALGGFMVSRLPFLNHLATAAWMPALSLFFSRPLPLAMSLALMFLAGYPTTVPGACLSAWALAWALRDEGSSPWPRLAAVWVAAAALALVLSGAQLLPAVELAALSRRAAMGAGEILQWSFAPRDLLQWTTPWLVPLSRFRPEVDWWRCVYLGAFGFAAAAAGAWALPRRRAAAVGLWLAFVATLQLGGGNPLSAALWKPLSSLSFVRYPGNLAYMAWPAAAALAAAGLRRRGLGAWWALAIALELVMWARTATPLAPRELFTRAGPLARGLQERLGGTRYLISPLALEASRGADPFDWKTRLYGLSNAPYRLRAAGNFGEPLVPAPSYAVMDALFSLPSAAAAADWMPWVGASRLLTPAPVASDRFRPEGRALWEISAVRGEVSTAYLLTDEAAGRLSEDFVAPGFAPTGALPVVRPREDSLRVSGSGAGRLFLAEPHYPGWSANLLSDGVERAVTPRRALGAFQAFDVPAGEWTVRLVYAPFTFYAGVLASLLGLLLVGAYWYHRAPRVENL